MPVPLACPMRSPARQCDPAAKAYACSSSEWVLPVSRPRRLYGEGYVQRRTRAAMSQESLGWHRLPRESDCAAPLLCRHLDIQQRSILLCAENVRVAGAAAWPKSVEREFDRVPGVELDEVGDALVRDAVELAHRLAGEHACPFYPFVGGALGEDNVEGDEIDPRVLAADSLRQRR